MTNHEPECIPVVTKIYDINDPCPLCTMVRKAYKRGQEDALKPVRELAENFEQEGIRHLGESLRYRLAANRIFGAISAAKGCEHE